MRFASLLVLCGVTASGATALTVQISSEVAPSGGWAQIKVTLPNPQLITKGELVVKLDPSVFGTTEAVATFSAAGDAFGFANITGSQVDAQFTSPSGGIGRLPGLPVLTLTVPMLSMAAAGTISAITADASQSTWTDGSGNPYTVTVLPGSVTIGGSLSIQNLSPGGGLLPAGTVVKINGTGFTASTAVEIDGVAVQKTQFVSAQEIDVTLAGAAELTGKRVVVGSEQYFSAMPSAPDRLPATGVYPRYMLSLQTFSSAGQDFNLIGGGLMVLQNQNLTPVTVYFQLQTPVAIGFPPVTIPAGELYVYSSGELGGGAETVAVASLPIRMLAPSFGNPGYFIPPLQQWAVVATSPVAQRPTAQPSAISFTWQIGTTTPAAVNVGLSELLSSAFTLVASGAPFSVTPSQGTLPGMIFVSVNPSGLSVGTYNGSINVTPVGPNATTITIPMSLNVTSAPFIGTPVSSLLQFYDPENSYQPAQPQTIQVTSFGNPTTFTASSNVPWMTVSPASGTAPGTISAAFSIAGLAAGTYNGQLLLTGPANSVTVPVEFEIASSVNTIPVHSISFSAQTGGLAPASQSISGYWGLSTVSVSGGSWLSAVVQSSPAGGSAVVVSANPKGLTAGTYTATITVSATGYLAAQWPVTLVVYDTLPPLMVTPSSLTFSGPSDGLGTQTLTVQSGAVPLSFTWSTSTSNVTTSVCNTTLESPCSGMSPLQTPGVVQATPVPLETVPPGFYHANIAFTAAGETTNVPVTISATPAAGLPPYLGSIVNAASQIEGAISPGEIVTMYGFSVGPFETAGFAVDSSGKVVTSLQGATVLFDGKAAPLIYGSAGQLNVMAPFEIAGQSSTVISLNYGSVASTAWAVPVATSAPGIFTIAGDGVGAGAVLNQDNSVNSAANPAARGSVVQIYVTGEGQTSPSGVTGSVTQSNTKTPLLGVTVTIGGVAAVLQYAGSAPDSIAGLMQVNAVVPQGIATGAAVPIVVSVGGVASQAGVTIAVK
jgi:uncharacterized protein (TIGR03437 family)